MEYSWKGAELHRIRFKYTQVHVWAHWSKLARRGVTVNTVTITTVGNYRLGIYLPYHVLWLDYSSTQKGNTAVQLYSSTAVILLLFSYHCIKIIQINAVQFIWDDLLFVINNINVVNISQKSYWSYTISTLWAWINVFCAANQLSHSMIIIGCLET